MPREEHFTFLSEQGSTKIHGIRWIPDRRVKAIIQISHGMEEHIERYRELGNYFASKGILVTGHDHIGHGASVASAEDYGYFAEKKGNEVLISDLLSVCHITKELWSNVPYFMLGHSMGSFLARQFLCQHGEELDGIVICGTGYQALLTVSMGKMICRVIACFKGWRYRSGLVYKIAFGSYNKRIKPLRTEGDWLCSRDEVVDAYGEDARCGFRFTLNGYYNMFCGLGKIIQKSYLEHMPKNMPVFFISGAEDPVGAYGKGVMKVIRLFRQYGMKNVKYKLYPKDRHEILNEEDRFTVFEDVERFVETVAARR